MRPQLLTGLAACVLVMWGIASLLLYAPALPAGQPARPDVGGVQAVAPPSAYTPVDCGREVCVALTFDDGPSAETTPLVLDALARHQARATFFVLGTNVAGNEQLIRRMYQEGHEIGNHSWNHPKFTTLTPEQIQDQIDLTQVAVANTGVPAPTLLRPPYGDINDVVASHIPMTIALWNADPADWGHHRAEEVPGLIESHVRPGRVVVLHDTHRRTAESLDAVIANLQKSYKLVTFSELFDLSPGQPGRYYGR